MTSYIGAIQIRTVDKTSESQVIREIDSKKERNGFVGVYWRKIIWQNWIGDRF